MFNRYSWKKHPKFPPNRTEPDDFDPKVHMARYGFQDNPRFYDYFENIDENEELVTTPSDYDEIDASVDVEHLKKIKRRAPCASPAVPAPAATDAAAIPSAAPAPAAGGTIQDTPSPAAVSVSR